MANNFKEINSSKKTNKFEKATVSNHLYIPQHEREKLIAHVGGHDIFYWLDYGVVMPSLCTTNGSAQMAAQWIVKYAKKGHQVTSSLVVSDWTDEPATLYALMIGAKAARQEIMKSLRAKYGERTFY